MKIQTEITGNEKTISLIYTKTIEGSAGNVKPGDTLFNLTKRVEGLITNWSALEPRLSEKPTVECYCFMKE